MMRALQEHPLWKAYFHIDHEDTVVALRGRNMVALGTLLLGLNAVLCVVLLSVLIYPGAWLALVGCLSLILVFAIVLARRGHVDAASTVASVSMAAIIPIGGALSEGMGSSSWYLVLSVFVAGFTNRPGFLWILLLLNLNLLIGGQFVIGVDYDGDTVPTAPFVATLLLASTTTLYTFTKRMWTVVRELDDKTAALEEARQHAEHASEAKSAFLANMSHELRTPLNAIIGYSELLMEDSADKAQPLDGPQLQQDLGRIRLAGSHLLAMINDILDVSKIEDGKMELHMERVNLAAVLADLMAIAEPLAAARGNRLELMRYPGLPEHIVCDGTRLRQILLNLLSNASKFTERGRITLSVRLAETFLVLSVQDTGVGIEPEKLESIFESFVQVGDRRLARAGSGLGLALSRQLAELLGGRLIAASMPGEGSTFSLHLPVEAVSDVRQTMMVLSPQTDERATNER